MAVAYVPATFPCPLPGCIVFPFGTQADLDLHLAAHFGDSTGTPAVVVTDEAAGIGPGCSTEVAVAPAQADGGRFGRESPRLPLEHDRNENILRTHFRRILLGIALTAASLTLTASPAVAAPVLTTSTTVIFNRTPVVIWFQIYDNHSLVLCQETDSGNIHLGTALTCKGFYDLRNPIDVVRLSTDYRVWVMAALQPVPIIVNDPTT